MQYFRTAQVAKAVGLHPNTIRLYEEWGLLPPIERTPAGYRLFTQEHIDQVKLIRLALRCSQFGRGIKRITYQLIYLSAAAKFDEALECAVLLKSRIQKECWQADQAEKYLEQWAVESMKQTEPATEATHIAAAIPTFIVSTCTAAKVLEITPDMLRDWERNNLIHIPRNSENGYREFGPDEINRLRVIRSLRRSRYSNMAILRAMQKLQSGSVEGLREALDCPEPEEDREYRCFNDTLLTSLASAKEAVEEILTHLQAKSPKN